MTPDDKAEVSARLHRINAMRLKHDAAVEELYAVSIETGAHMRRFAETVAAAEARDVAEHPDLAELNLQLDGYYD